MSGPTVRCTGSTCAAGRYIGRDGSIKSLVGVCSDITARKTAEIERETLVAQLAAERTALAELTATLEQRVEQRSADLMKAVAAREKAQEQLRQAQKMETIGQLTGGVAHDFNNLLMAVMGNLDLLRKRLPDDPRLHRLVEGAMQGAERGASLTQRLLAFARQQDLRAVSVDLRTLIEGMIDLLERSLGPRVELRLDIHRGLPPARIDPNQLELAILNLAINARDAMPDGGRIDIRCSGGSGEGRCGVGSGPVSQVVGHRYRHRHVTGNTGARDRAILLDQAGRQGYRPGIVDGAWACGSTGWRVAAVEHRRKRNLRDTGAAGRYRRAGNGKSGAASGKAQALGGHPVRRRRSTDRDVDHGNAGRSRTPRDRRQFGQHALDILRSEQPIDLMMTDHMMPGMTGMELAAATREVRPSLPILLATGYAELPEGTQLNLPRLAKPYHQDQLREQLDQLLA